MQSFVNQPFLAKRAKYSKWGLYVGFGSLFAGLMTATRIPLLAYLLLLVGLLGATFGSYMANRYVREPRVDQVLENMLGGMDKRYSLYSYYLPSDYVIVSHFGLTVVVPRTQDGEISYTDGRWRHKAGIRKVMQFFGEPSLGKPDQDLNRRSVTSRNGLTRLCLRRMFPSMGSCCSPVPKRRSGPQSRRFRPCLLPSFPAI